MVYLVNVEFEQVLVMSLFEDYLEEIESRSDLGLKAKPIEDGKLINSIIDIILDEKNKTGLWLLTF